MKRTMVHEEIEEKFTIKNKSTGLLVTETEQKEGYLTFIRYPAVFNTKEDAEKYLKTFDLDDDERNDVVIENMNIPSFHRDAILISFE